MQYGINKRYQENLSTENIITKITDSNQLNVTLIYFSDNIDGTCTYLLYNHGTVEHDETTWMANIVPDLHALSLQLSDNVNTLGNF